MRIHTDKIDLTALHNALGELSHLLELEVATVLPRKRTRAFEVSLIWGGTGQWGASSEYSEYSATWDEWGEWIAKLFEIDPEAIIGPYEGYDDFLQQTSKAKEWANRGKAKAPWLD